MNQEKYAIIIGLIILFPLVVDYVWAATEMPCPDCVNVTESNIIEEPIPEPNTTSIEPVNATQPIPEPEPAPEPMLEPTQIPKWVKGIFQFWVDGFITDEELIEALQFLIRTGIIVV